MEATLKFNLPEENAEFELAVNGSKMHSVLWDMDQWLRAQYKYMPDEEYSEDKYETYEKCREHLREIISEHNINLDL
jgi:coproporphyrinogen III oxidase